MSALLILSWWSFHILIVFLQSKSIIFLMMGFFINNSLFSLYFSDSFSHNSFFVLTFFSFLIVTPPFENGIFFSFFTLIFTLTDFIGLIFTLTDFIGLIFF